MSTRELFTDRVRVVTAKRNREERTHWLMVEDSAQNANPAQRIWRWYSDLSLQAEITFSFDRGKLSIDTVIEKRSWSYDDLPQAIQYIDEFLAATQ